MQTIRFSGRKPNPQIIEIGMETDSGAETLRFLVPQISDGQEATLQMILPDGTADALLLRDGMTVIPARIMEIAGTARAWVEILGSDTLAWHSEMLYLGIGETPEISGRSEQQYPTAFQDAMAQTLANKDAAAASAAAAETSATAAGVAADTAANSAAAAVVSAAHAANSASAAGASATVAANSASAAAASARKAEAMAGLTIDRTPTAGSINPVASGGVKTALDGKKNIQTAVTDPTASGTGVAFIDSIVQDDQGVITPTKKTVSTMGAASASAAGSAGLVPAPAKGKQGQYLRGDGTWNTPTDTTYGEATTSAAGLMSAADKTKLDGIAAGAQVNTLTGVKGSAESAYRTGNVNLTAANIGAAAASHGNHVPATETADNTKFLRNDNSWQKVTPANIGAKGTQTAVSDPTASGNAVSFIDSITQNAQGVITPTKKTVQSASQNQAGLMSAADKTKLDGIAAGATANAGTITGITMNGASKGTSGVVNLGTVFQQKQLTSETTDLDSVTTPGVYDILYSSSVSTADRQARHVPVTNAEHTWCNLIVHGVSNRLSQICMLPYSHERKFYYRFKHDSGWSGWQEIVTSAVSTSKAGLMSAADKTKLDGIAAGAQVNTLTGVKGNAESAYRTGNVNLTPANIGAAAASHGNHVPATETADNTKFLRNDNSWQKVTPANIGAKATQSAVSDPTASGNAVSFIDSITQNAQGVITPTKKTVQSASQNQAGLMSAADKTKLDGIAAGATANAGTITGITMNGASKGTSGVVNLGTVFQERDLTTDTTDLDSVTTPGVYNVLYTASVSTADRQARHVPVTNAEHTWCNLIVHGIQSRLSQICMLPYSHERKFYYRFKHDSGWSGWQEIVTSAASTSKAGLMSAADKTKLDGLNKAVTADLGTLTGTGGMVTVTKTVSGVTASMTPDRFIYSNPSAVTDEPTVTTATNSVTFSAKVNGSTTVKVKLSNNTDVTGT